MPVRDLMSSAPDRRGTRGQVHPPLVARDAELRSLRHEISELARKQGRFVAITGAQGAGKTRLVRDAVAYARDAGARVVGGADDHLAAGRPFATIAAVLEPLVTTMRPHSLRTPSSWGSGRLAHVLPSLQTEARAAAAVSGPTTQTERWHAHRAVRDLLARAAEDGPLLVYLDDLHVADPATIELVTHLVARAPLPGVMIMVAYRPSEAPELLQRAAIRATLERTLSMFELRPVCKEDIGCTVDALDRAPCRLAHADSGRSAAHAERDIAVVCEGAADRQRAREEPAASTRSELAYVLDKLQGSSTRVVQAGAVLGDVFDLDVAADMAGVDQASVLAAFDELSAGDVLGPGVSGRAAAFRHPHDRHSIYSRLGAEERRRLHARAVRALDARSGSPWAVAHHIARSAKPGDRAAIERLAAAGRDAAVRAPHHAAGWLAVALRLVGDVDARERVELLTALAQAQMLSGDLQASRDTLADALAISDPNPSGVRSSVVTLIEQLRALRAERDDGRRLLADELIARTGDDVKPASAELRLARATSDVVMEGAEADLRAVGNVLRFARRLDEGSLTFAATALLALAHRQRGEILAAQAAAKDAVAQLDVLSDGALVSRLAAVALLGRTLHGIERTADASRVLERGIAVAVNAEAGAWSQWLLLALANVRCWQGRLAESSRITDRAVAISAITANDSASLWATVLRGRIAGEQGDLDTALTVSAQAVEMATQAPSRMLRGTALAVRAQVLQDAGRSEDARDTILKAGGHDLVDIVAPFRPQGYVTLVKAQLGSNDLAAAEAALDRANALSARLALPGRRADVLHAGAIVLLANRQPGRAAVHAARAGRLHRSAGALCHAARDDLVLARALILGGNRLTPAVAALQAAHALSSETGALRVREQAERELAQLGVRTGAHRHVATASGARLSARERRLAGLIAEGLDNASIAAELQLSVRSVEREITRLRRKLTASSRAAMASMTARHREEL
ncbi:MAG: hypothetical protein V7607_1725 [Solirubrobacteraceae bacterium]